MPLTSHGNALTAQETEAWFDSDVDGAMFLWCGPCERYTLSFHGDVGTSCRGCKKEFVYRPWCEW